MKGGIDMQGHAMVFVLQRNFGVAVVIAESFEEALKLLQEKEAADGCPGYLSGGINPSDFKMIHGVLRIGVHTYHAD